MKKLFLPAIKLMKRLSYSRKMLVAGLFFCVPIALLAYFLVNNIREQVHFSAKERSGVRYAVALDGVLAGVLESRNAVAGGEAPSVSPEKALAELEKVEELFGRELATGERFQGLKAKLGETVRAHGTPGQSFAVHTALADDLLDMTVLVADNSNLTLDPDIDSYYLMDSVITKLPPLAETISRAALIASRPSALPGDRTDLIVLSGKITNLVEALNKNMRAAGGANPALGERLKKPLQEVEFAATKLTLRLPPGVSSARAARPGMPSSRQRTSCQRSWTGCSRPASPGCKPGWPSTLPSPCLPFSSESISIWPVIFPCVKGLAPCMTRRARFPTAI